MKFLVCERQYGDGCDYMIGCGMRSASRKPSLIRSLRIGPIK